MKVIIPVSFDVNMKSIYSQIKPLISKKDFIKEIRSEVNQYVKACLDTSTETNIYGLEETIINSLVNEGYAEYIKN